MRKVKRDKFGRFIKGEKQWGKRPEIKKWLEKFQFKKGHKSKKPFKKGQHVSPETEFKKGIIPWSKKNKGKYHLWENRQHPTKGKPSPLKGIPRSEKTKRKLSEQRLGKHYPKLSKSLKGKVPWNKNKKGVYSKETIELMKKNRKGKHSGENHYNFNNWSSREPYGIEFNKQLKEKIRARDNYECQKCHIKQEELKRKLDVHHIDYNKKNNSEINLISLCLRCHNKTNFDRNHWKRYFQMQMFIRELFNPENLLIFDEDKRLIGLKR